MTLSRLTSPSVVSLLVAEKLTVAVGCVFRTAVKVEVVPLSETKADVDPPRTTPGPVMARPEFAEPEPFEFSTLHVARSVPGKLLAQELPRK